MVPDFTCATLPPRSERVDESQLERIAGIIGPQSAAQKCLDDMAKLRAEGGNPWCFKIGDALVVMNMDLAMTCPLSGKPCLDEVACVESRCRLDPGPDYQEV